MLTEAQKAQLIQSHQVKPYDDASRTLAKCGGMIAEINTAGFSTEHINKLDDLYREVIKLKHELFSLAHTRFLAERAGDVEAGE